MAVAGGDIESYLLQLSAARASVDRLTEPDRSLGLAAIRLEATELYRHLHTTGAPDATVLTPLATHVAALTGGEVAEKTIGAMEALVAAQAKQAVNQIALAALTGKVVITGVLGGVMTFLALFTDVAFVAGTDFVSAVAAGVVPGYFAYLLMRGAGPSASAAQGTWAWASSLATTADAQLRPSRESGRRLWAGAGGSTAPSAATVTARARRIAMTVVGAAALLLGIGIVAFGFGVLQGLGM